MSERERHSEVEMGSERSLGIVFAGVFAVAGLWPLAGHGDPRLWALGVAGVFLSLGLALPRALRPLNVVWFKFGMLLGAVVSPVVMGLVFFIAVTPTALVMRAAGKDPLKRKLDRNAPSYWIPREAPVGTMKNQY